jgi:hypothetical protein
MRKLLFTMLFVVLAVCCAKPSFSEEGSGLTNLALAEYLQGQLNIAVPAGIKGLPQDQYFTALANALAAAGIGNFQNTAYDAQINYGKLVDVLFVLAKGPGDPDTAGKVDYLVSNGYLAAKPSTEAMVSMAELRQIFTNPQLSGFIAQTYVAPDVNAAGGPGTQAPGVTAELPASQI